jgi:carbonic anhydrase/acetyltransferase-like protein (isoleucine patch superfamily)
MGDESQRGAVWKMNRLRELEYPDFSELLNSSELLNIIRTYRGDKKKSSLFGDNVRTLTQKEIGTLVSQGNRSDAWELIRVKNGFTPLNVYYNTFCGQCVLGVFSGEEVEIAEGVSLRSGVYSSTLVSSEIGDNALVNEAGIISNYVVGNRAVVYRVDALTASGKCSFGNGREVSLGIETGGREVRLYAEITVKIAWAIAARRGDRALQKRYSEFVDSYEKEATLPFGVVEGGSIIRFVSKVVDSWVGRGVEVDGAQLIEDCTLLGADEEPTTVKDGSCVIHSCMQWGSEVTSMAIVEDSVIAEHSSVERHGKVTGSIIGPNTSIAEGEVTASLVGPFVGFHHQALLIAALWPEGKGNVGYGANVGSNHTSKAPDQEIICGEGLFFGLGVNVKYPSDFTNAPYSIIATAVDLLPQRVEFPFSLINKPKTVPELVSPSYNEILPGWVLRDNIYMVRRNEGKYRKRNKARRSSFIFDVFRQDIVERMVLARQRLIEAKNKKLYYTEEDIPGLGKNFLAEESRKQAIESYTFFIRYYALLGLKRTVAQLLEHGCQEGISGIYSEDTENGEWEYQRSLLRDEGLAEMGVARNLKELLTMQKKIARSTQESKERDDLRGKRILREYYDAHTEASGDPFVLETWEETRMIEGEIQALIAKVESATREETQR